MLGSFGFWIREGGQAVGKKRRTEERVIDKLREAEFGLAKGVATGRDEVLERA